MKTSRDDIVTSSEGEMVNNTPSTRLDTASSDVRGVAALPTPSKKRTIINQILFYKALFFPLFLASLDTSTTPYTSRLIGSNRCFGSPSYIPHPLFSYVCRHRVLL